MNRSDVCLEVISASCCNPDSLCLSEQMILSLGENHLQFFCPFFLFFDIISAFGMKDNKKTSIFNQECFFFLPPWLTDLQPVKIQLNNSACSAFPTPFGTNTHTYSTGTCAHTNTPMMGSQQYDI